MGKTKKKLSTHEKLAKDRLRKKQKYAEIKSDSEKYRLLKEAERKKYILRKENKKILSITEMTDRQKREQRRKWRNNSRKYLNKLKDKRKLESVLLENSPPSSETEEILNTERDIDSTERDPLMDIEKNSDTSLNTDKIPNMKQDTSSMLRKLRYRSSKVISDLQAEINKLKKEKNSLTVQLYQVQRRQKIKKSIEDTIEKKVDQVIKDIKMDKIENVRKNLLFSETVNRGVFEKYKSLPKMQKRTFAKDIVDESRLKKMQYSTVKELKENLSDNEVLIHVDFSENYLLKYNEEIQSFHFGGSRQQISLHTGVLYYRDSQTKEITCKSFCTVSENIRHDALTIWAHLEL
ncbi:hypothetical protein ACJJTC_004341 [Scirpophaga incertulas]